MPRLFAAGRPVLDDVKLMIFDKDGTIFDIHHYWATMIRMRAALLADRHLQDQALRPGLCLELESAMGLDSSIGRLRPGGPVGTRPRREVVQAVEAKLLNLGIPKEAGIVEDAFAAIDRATSDDLVPLLTLLPGVNGLLNEAKAKGVFAAIATTDITPRAIAALKALGLADAFSAIAGSDLVQNSKPAPDLCHEILQRLGVAAQNAVVIGDHPVDAEMAEKAGVGATIAVLTGLGQPADFSRFNCWTVRDLTEIRFGPPP